MSAPTNGTAATAIDLTSSVPYAAVIDTTGASTDPEVLISGSTAADRAVWWSYRNNDAVFYKLVEISSIGVDAGSGYPITNYYSITSVWRGSPGSLTQAFERHDAWVDTGSPGDDRGNYLSVPVAPGETIYILISDNDSNLGGSLSLSVEATRLQRGTLIASNVSASDTDRGQWLTAFASDGSATGRDAPIHNGGTLTGIAQHPTTREVLAYNAGSNFPLVRLSPTLGLIERCATIWTSLTPTFVGSNFQWGAQGLAIDPTTGDILLLWAGSNVGGSNIGHHELQRRDATTWALLEQWSDFIPATLLGTAGINVMPGQVSPDGTSYYLTTQGSTGTGQNKVFKLDLGSGVVTTFATVGTWSGGVNPTGNFCQWQPVVLSDGRVVTAWTHMTTGTADQLHVVVHNSGGSLVIDFDLTTDVGTGLAIRTGPAVTLDESEIWIEYQSHGGGAFPNWLDRFTLATGANAHHVEALTDTDGVDIRFRDLLVLATLGGLCYGGGEVAIQADPPDGTPFSGRQLNPRAMLQLNFDDQTRYYSNDALNTPTRRHRGSVIQFGTITRQLSDRTSPYKVADCQVDVDDSDRHLSILEATAASEHWQNREAKVTVQNLDSLAAGETPHTLGRFIWRKHLSSGLQRTIGLTDVLGSEFSDFNLERSLPTRQVKDDFPGAPEDSLERYVPIAMGVFPDRSGRPSMPVQ
jgi:hypothetical protein